MLRMKWTVAMAAMGILMIGTAQGQTPIFQSTPRIDSIDEFGRVNTSGTTIYDTATDPYREMSRRIPGNERTVNRPHPSGGWEVGVEWYNPYSQRWHGETKVITPNGQNIFNAPSAPVQPPVVHLPPVVQPSMPMVVQPSMPTVHYPPVHLVPQPLANPPLFNGGLHHQHFNRFAPNNPFLGQPLSQAPGGIHGQSNTYGGMNEQKIARFVGGSHGQNRIEMAMPGGRSR